jgi:hypothetical protein
MDMTPTLALAASGKVALLVDGENISAAHAPRILRDAAMLGEVTVRRVYGKSAHVAEWENHGFRLIPASAAKNSADLALCVDAMTLALREEFPTLVIASSDRDFSPLALQLRELGYLAVGLGMPQAPEALRQSFSHFIMLDTVLIPAVRSDTVRLTEAKPVSTPAPKPTGRVTNAKVDAAAVRICSDLDKTGAPIPLTRLCQHLASEGVSLAQIGVSKWSTYFEGHPRFDLIRNGQNFSIRPL